MTTEHQRRLAAWIRGELRHPKAEGEGRNNQMIKVAPSMLRLGWPEERVLAAFKEAFGLKDDSSKDDEIERVIQNAKAYANRPHIGSGNRSKCQDIVQGTRMKLDGILQQHSWPESELRSLGWAKLPNAAQRSRFLTTLFAPGDYLWSGTKFHSGKPIHARHFKTAAEWADEPRGWPFISHCTFRNGTISRAVENVVSRKYMILESDELKTDEILAVFRWLEEAEGLKLRAAVFSGNRSIHGWFDWPGNDPRELDAFVRGLRCDPAVLRPSQPVRLPGVIRIETGKLQELLYLDAPL